MKVKDYFSQEVQKHAEEFFRFDFVNGRIYWKKIRYGGCKIGSEVGYVVNDPRSSTQRIQITINGQKFLRCRLLYCFFHRSSFEGLEIDHLDQNTLNDKITNLKSKTRSGNQQNRTRNKNNKSGFTGVGWNQRRGEWVSRINVNCESIFLGYFENIEDAIEARKAAEIKYGFHKNHGQPKQKV